MRPVRVPYNQPTEAGKLDETIWKNLEEPGYGNSVS